MNDPWDVKAVRQGHQYQSCMKINGVPLLPPVLSKECRKEMQYYKLLAKEVEKRISILKPYVDNDTDSNDDKTDVPEIPECEQIYEPSQDKIEPSFDYVIQKSSSATELLSEKCSSFTPVSDRYHPDSLQVQEAKLIIDLNLQLNENDKELFENTRALHHSVEQDDLPERDCDFTPKPIKEKELLTDVETNRKCAQIEVVEDIVDYEFHLPIDRDEYVQLHNEGPPSLTSKSFTGSLHDLHSESVKEAPKLMRQSSYTLLKPSPQLLAHLEVQSMSTGVDMNSISMSESVSNLSLPNKKRRSWDLESAKVKWSSMALELKKTANLSKQTNGVANHRNGKKSQTSPGVKAQTQSHEKGKKNGTRSLKSEHKSKNVGSPVRNTQTERSTVKESMSPQNRSMVKITPPKSASSKKDDATPKDSTVTLISNSDDPAARVRELYEKLQKQQLMQMASLMEKQKREQQLLQQVFEEQNTVLLKQLKTVCPKVSPIEVKQAWLELKDDTDRGPVSLSQLINTATPEDSMPGSPVATLTESKNFINKCDSMLKKCRDITSNNKRQPKNTKPTGSRTMKSQEQIQSPPDANNARAHSPTPRVNSNTSRRLTYDTSASSDYEPITPQDLDVMLTDRTNDTMADLNVTLPSDNSEEYRNMEKSIPDRRKSTTVRACSPTRNTKNISNSQGKQSTDSAIKTLENSIQNSMNTLCNRPPVVKASVFRPATQHERVAATKIVAWAKGYLVRRLLGTERVQATVQTIRDALLCALQLHQDREGIRGADVDLHRRLIQQITAACYSLHDTFITSSPAERCALIAADRARKQALANRQTTPRSARRTDVLDKDSAYTLPPLPMISYPESETFSGDKARARYVASPRRRPWR